MAKKNSERSVTSSFPGRPLKRRVKLEKKREGGGGEAGAGKKKQGEKSMTGNLGICRTEIGSHLKRLSKRKADFTADGSAVAGLQTPGARLGQRAAAAAVADLLTQSHSSEMGSSEDGKRRAIFRSSLSLLDRMQIKSWSACAVLKGDNRLRQFRMTVQQGWKL